MKTKRTGAIILTTVLIVLVMAVSFLISASGLARREQVEHSSLWQVAARQAVSINITDLTGDGERDVFVQSSDGIRVLDANGQAMFDLPLSQPFTTSLGDVDGDGTPDLVIYTAEPTVTVLTGQGETLWQRTLPGKMAAPGRVLSIDFENDGRHETVVGDIDGLLIALTADGERLWEYELIGGGSLRGLDEVQLPDGDLVTAGLEGGLVVTLDKTGHLLWQTQAEAGLRRLRAFPLRGPVDGHVFVGSVSGQLVAHQPGDGRPAWQAFLGQAVNEIRPVEADGDPATTEVGVGGKDGGVWALSQDGQQLWRGSVGSKVNEITGLDAPDLGGPVVLFGDDSGGVAVYDTSGSRLLNFDVSGAVERLEEGKLGDTRGVIVAGSQEITFFSFAKQSAPFWYTPIVAGLLASLVIAAVAFLLTRSLQPAPTLSVSAQAMNVEAQKAQRRMLHESIQDLKQMRDVGEIASNAYLARLRKLREQLAQVNANLMQLGEPVAVETITCPHCNGTLALGTDTCEYCGQIVIS